MVGLSRVTDTLRAIATEFTEKNVTFMAAGIAYNAFLSLAPILVILLAVVSSVGGGLEERVVRLAQRNLPGPIADIVVQVFEGSSGESAASVVGIVVLVWGTLKIFRGLDTAFSEIYETTAENTFLDKLLDGLVVLVALILAIAATVGVTAAFASFAEGIPYLGLLTPLLLVAGLVIAFAPIYYRFPDTDIQWQAIIPGAIFAAVGWALFQAVFQVYLTFTGGGSSSLFGGVIVVVTWLYFSGLVLLLGAVINAVLGGHTSGKAGGVGEGASEYDTHFEEEMDVDEFRLYLERLRSTMAGISDEEHLAEDRYPEPAGSIRVIEQSKPADENREMSIGFQWIGENEDPK